jgi:hypothetical protein
MQAECYRTQIECNPNAALCGMQQNAAETLQTNFLFTYFEMIRNDGATGYELRPMKS